jgi:hypothetical protein
MREAVIHLLQYVVTAWFLNKHRANVKLTLFLHYYSTITLRY